jgi:hypothetical protein
MAFKRSKWKFTGIPDFKTPTEIAQYFSKEEKYWKKGRFGLEGEYYKYLTMYQIRDRTTGEEFFPDYRQVDHEVIFPWLKEVQKNNMDGMWITQRGAGKSTIISGYLPLETAISNPGCKVIMTADSVETTKTNFSEKLKVAYEGLHPNYRPSLAAEWPDEKTDRQYVKFGMRKRGHQDKGLGSIIQSIETAHSPKSPNKLEGQGSKLVIVDEIYKHPYVSEVRSRGGPLTKRYQEKVGSMVFVGSLSDATAKGIKTANELWDSAGTLGILPLFVDATWFNPLIQKYDERGMLIPGQYVDVRVDGNPGILDRKKAREAFLQNRLVLERLPNKQVLFEYIMMYPLELSELLDVSKETWWSEEEMLEMNNQKKVISMAVKTKDFLKCDRPAVIYKDHATDKLRVDYDVYEDSARYFIFEEPVEGRSYGIGIDTIPFVTNNTEGSDHVAVVKCFDTNQYVAMYAERSYDANVVARNTINLQRLYHDAPALIEKNSIGALKTAYENIASINLLAYTPIRFRPKGWTRDRGLNKDRNTPELRQLVRDYLFGRAMDDGCLKYMFMRRFYEEYPFFPFENTDFIDAMAMAEALHEDHRTLMRHRSKDAQVPQTKIIYKTVNGKRIMTREGATKIAKDGSLDLSHLFKPPKNR